MLVAMKNQVRRRMPVSSNGIHANFHACGMKPTADTAAISAIESPCLASQNGTAICSMPTAALKGSSMTPKRKGAV